MDGAVPYTRHISTWLPTRPVAGAVFGEGPPVRYFNGSSVVSSAFAAVPSHPCLRSVLDALTHFLLAPSKKTDPALSPAVVALEFSRAVHSRCDPLVVAVDRATALGAMV